MTETPEGQFEAPIEWPSDTHANAAVSNFMAMSDDGQGVYLSFGHVAPFVGPPPAGLTRVVPKVAASVYMTYKNAAELAQVLNTWVGMKQAQEGGSSD